MATMLSALSPKVFSHSGCNHIVSQIQAGRTLMLVRSRSNALSVTRIRRTVYPRMYPSNLVFPDGSTINIRYQEPRRIIMLPLDFSKLTEEEKKNVLANRKPKQKLEKIEDFGESIDLSEYGKFFKN